MPGFAASPPSTTCSTTLPWLSFCAYPCRASASATRRSAPISISRAISASCVRFSVVAEPVLETCRAKARIIAGGDALIVHRIAVVERLGIGDYRSWVPGCVQESPHEVVLADRFGTRQFDGAIQRLGEGHIGHDGCHIIRLNGLHHDRWKPDR